MWRRPLEWNLNGTTDPRDGSVDHLSLNSLKDRHGPIRAPKSPKVEAEIAFVIGRDLDDEHLTIADILRAVEFALPAIEIVDSRIADWKIGILDTIADNASSGLYVLGASPKKLDGLELRLCGMVM